MKQNKTLKAFTCFNLVKFNLVTKPERVVNLVSIILITITTTKSTMDVSPKDCSPVWGMESISLRNTEFKMRCKVESPVGPVEQ